MQIVWEGQVQVKHLHLYSDEHTRIQNVSAFPMCPFTSIKQ